MMTQKLPSIWGFLWVSLFLCAIGWGGLILLVFLTVPTLGPRWLFFFLVTVALTGTALPVMYFLNRRFPTNPPVESSVILREAMWVGVYASLVSWLQMGRVLTPGLLVVLAVGLILVEFLLRLSERSQWSPEKNTPPEEQDADALAADEDEDEDA